MPGSGLDAANALINSPAWKVKPAYYLVALDDQMLGQVLQRRMADRVNMTIAESPGGHTVYMSHPEAVASLGFVDEA